mgnify:FL=1
MTINIEIVRVEVENKGKYQQASVIYKGSDGKVANKSVVSFVNKEVYTKLKDAQPGDLFEVESEKDDKGYWQWTKVNGVGKNVGGTAPAVGKVSPRSTYETPEERAAKQIYIVRQSSISASIALLKDVKHTPSVEEVIETAKAFEKYVFSQEPLLEVEVV